MLPIEGYRVRTAPVLAVLGILATLAAAMFILIGVYSLQPDWEPVRRLRLMEDLPTYIRAPVLVFIGIVPGIYGLGMLCQAFNHYCLILKPDGVLVFGLVGWRAMSWDDLIAIRYVGPPNKPRLSFISKHPHAIDRLLTAGSTIVYPDLAVFDETMSILKAYRPDALHEETATRSGRARKSSTSRTADQSRREVAQVDAETASHQQTRELRQRSARP